MKQRVSNETYEIYDIEGTEVVMSRTTLYGYKATRGHSHENEEMYYFAGFALIELDGIPYTVMAGTLRRIPPNVHHRVFNMIGEPLEFVCCWRRT